MIANCTTKPPAASTIQASGPSAAAINAAIAEPIGRAPNVAVVISADTRPSMAAGVTTWRNVVELMTHKTGPAPIRKKLSVASTIDGIHKVSTITREAASPLMGPMTMLTPNGSRRISHGASRAAPTMPTP